MKRWPVQLKKAARAAGVLALMLITLFLATPPALLEDVSFSRAVYGRNGVLLRLTLSKDDRYRLFVPLQHISPAVIEAVLLHEDQHFYAHPGVNPAALARALWHHLVGGGRGGASTITMQVVRMKDHLHTRSYLGKIWQMAQAFRMELHYSKKEILEAYLNLVPYGSNIEGVAAASHIYFGREVDALSLPEALTLATVPQSPRARTPGRSAQTNEALQKARLREFLQWEEAHPEDAHYESLLHRPMYYRKKSDLPFIAPQWSARMLRESKEAVVRTTLDAGLQQQMSGLLQRYVTHHAEMGMANAAALLIDTRSMEVLASIGSADFFNLNRQGMIDGTRARRSPGSALKPFIYALAFEQGIIHPASLLVDAPTAYGSYAPENFDRLFQGPLSAHDALIKSRNIPALYLTSKLKAPSLYSFLKEAGIGAMKPEAAYGLSLALGGVEVTMEELIKLYAMLANDGEYRPLSYLLERRSEGSARKLSPEAAFITLSILADTPPPGGSLTSDTISLPVYWKTGTSGGLRDAWSIGIFGPYALAVWVGDFRGTTHGNYVGITHAAPLFFELVRLITDRTHPTDIIQSKAPHLHVMKSYACADTGDIDNPYCNAKLPVWIMPGVSPIKPTGIYRNMLVNRKTGKLACRYRPQETDYRVLQFWPSDIIQVFSEAGIHKPAAPEWEAGCNAGKSAVSVSSLRITSPARNTSYKAHMEGKNTLQLKASCDGHVHTLFWFVDDVPVAQGKPDDKMMIPLTVGKHHVRVIDDAGNADTVPLTVE